MSQSTIWISYDLGIRGDYESMYAWLDSHGARECVNSLAVLTYEYSGELIDALRKDLASSIDVSKRTRVYVVHRGDGKATKVKGTFLFGGRRAPQWAGFAEHGEQVSEDEA